MMVDQLRENFGYQFSNNFENDLIISIKNTNGAAVGQWGQVAIFGYAGNDGVALSESVEVREGIGHMQKVIMEAITDLWRLEL